MNTNNQLKTPYVSVIICSLNGAERIDACLNSINRQLFSRVNFEVIVIDDGSTDNTSDVAREHGAQVVRLERNKGIPTARNAGLSASKGVVVVYIDDDCVADPDWLKNLVAAFQDDVVATGGKILAYSRETIAERYMEAMGYGNPARAPKVNGGLIGRLLAYFETMISPIMDEKGLISVTAVYTANAAYRKNTLLSVGGFDEALRTSEDSDISARINARSGRIVYVPNAIVKHRHYKSLSKVISEPFSRAQNMLSFYLKERKIPPVFPMPVLFAFFVFLSVIFYHSQFPIVFVVIALIPLLLYPWWIIRGYREKRSEYVLYPYIQLVAESATILGLLRGLLGIFWQGTSISTRQTNKKIIYDY